MTMKLTRRALAAAFAAAPFAAHAQANWPTRPLRMIVPFAPGGGSDTLGRLLATPLGAELGQPVVVENRAGAGSQIGAEAVMRSPPDGLTLLLGDTPLATIPAVQAANNQPVAFDTARDFTPIATLGVAPALLVVASSSPFRTTRDLLEAAKARPEAVNVASGGTATSTHLMIELLQMRSGVKVTHVPYRGTGAALPDVLNNTVQAMIQAMATAAPLVAAGQMRVIGVAAEQRLAAMPDVPTLREQGVDLVAGFWWGVLGPAGIPAPIVARLREAIDKSMATETVQARLPALGLERLQLGPDDFRSMLVSETARWRDVVTTAGIKPE
ncbi:Bug family tripartite tricarboxylate transporter substrate binding protein [Falsiroseomonas tokyonensis]|uniref:Bug family tripartite tricarboxylate transporter substrate binding protein n=1 Tax=Falsiroseomonas tokyonensis TaxID=430521 RepID=A0ABV7BME3_9PROT|nr:tripartite tricarboxylate transporter substrate binding protein [Falsiroseomonas tokyonensis]MBU8536367.1 tripartite tricarboxylate transporter substrate binding protein [Falsiroseomonas tokyonensis]